MKLSEKLKYCRTKANLTQGEVSDLIHVSRKTISGWENDRSFPDINGLFALRTFTMFQSMIWFGMTGCWNTTQLNPSTTNENKKS